jgi:hypothetical protein
MKNTKLLLFFIIAVIGTQSCSIMYTPSMQNVPLFKEKNEIRATIGITDFQGAYAVSDKIGVMVNGSLSNGNQTTTYNYNYSSTSTSKGSNIEVGAGYYKLINENSVFEVYGGVGTGKNSIGLTTEDSINAIPRKVGSFTATTSRFFVQPSIGFTNDYFDLAFSTRFVLLKYSNISSFGYTPTMLYEDKLLNIGDPVFAFLEPALTMRFGYKYVKFHAQAMFSYKYNSDRLNYLPFNMNVGIHIDLVGLFNKKAPTNNRSSIE